MARLPRIVLPGIPHHVTQRGNRRERTFFEDGDYELFSTCSPEWLEDMETRTGLSLKPKKRGPKQYLTVK